MTWRPGSRKHGPKKLGPFLKSYFRSKSHEIVLDSLTLFKIGQFNPLSFAIFSVLHAYMMMLYTFQKISKSTNGIYKTLPGEKDDQ